MVECLRSEDKPAELSAVSQSHLTATWCAKTHPGPEMPSERSHGRSTHAIGRKAKLTSSLAPWGGRGPREMV